MRFPPAAAACQASVTIVPVVLPPPIVYRVPPPPCPLLRLHPSAHQDPCSLQTSLLGAEPAASDLTLLGLKGQREPPLPPSYIEYWPSVLLSDRLATQV